MHTCIFRELIQIVNFIEKKFIKTFYSYCILHKLSKNQIYIYKAKIYKNQNTYKNQNIYIKTKYIYKYIYQL